MNALCEAPSREAVLTSAQVCEWLQREQVPEHFEGDGVVTDCCDRRGTLRFDRRFGSLGWLNTASGATDPHQFRRINESRPGPA